MPRNKQLPDHGWYQLLIILAVSALCVTGLAGRRPDARSVEMPPSAWRHMYGAATPALVRYVIDGDYILQDFGEDGVSYLSKDQFD